MQGSISARTVRLAYMAFSMMLLGYCIFYWMHSTDELKLWFRALHPCFYRNEYWEQEFFTPDIKRAGNKWCIIATVFITLSNLYILIRWNKNRIYRFRWPSGADAWACGFLILTGFGLWCYSSSLTAPAYDELFSAVNCAGKHPFQCWSYYMLPNNQVLFNVLNSVLFFYADDKVYSGRVLSLFAYEGFLLTLFWFLRRCWPDARGWRFYAPALGAILLLALQMPVFGFAAQGRGYELQLLAGWLMIATGIDWYRRRSRPVLYLHSLAIAVGFCSIPSFMYLYAAWICLSGWMLARERRLDPEFWKAQAFGLTAVLLFYLPALSFSGISALADNRYVRPADQRWEDFLPSVATRMKEFMNYCFAYLWGENNRINYLLFLVPGVLLFARDRKKVWIGIGYFLLWGLFVAMMVKMKRGPFCRNLIVHYSITLAALCYAVFEAGRFAFRFVRAQTLSLVLFLGFMAAFAVHFVTTNEHNVANFLYFNEANKLRDQNLASIATLPAGSSIGFSDESFYWYYYCRKRNYAAHQCPDGNETYFIKRGTETVPAHQLEGYDRLRVCEEDYEIWKKR